MRSLILQSDSNGLNLRSVGRKYTIFKHDSPVIGGIDDYGFATQAYNNQLRRERELRRR